jgi:capsular exopolysaccharide synthesis family protein
MDTTDDGRMQPIRPPRRPGPRPDLEDALQILWRYKWSIIAISLLMLAVAVFVSRRQTPVYESEARVLVVPIDLGTETGPEEPNLATEAQVLSSVAVAIIVTERTESSEAPRTLLGDLSVDQPTDTDILEIAYRDADPETARDFANAFAQAYLEYRESIADEAVAQAREAIELELETLQRRLRTVERLLAPLDLDDPDRGSLQGEQSLLQTLILQAQLAQLQIPQEVSVGRVIQPASIPSSPISPNHVVNGAFGLVAGLALGGGLAFLRERTSGRVRTTDEAEDYLGAPVLGAIPRVPQWRRRKRAFLVARTQWGSPAAEAYRILRASVLSAVQGDGRSIVVTSPHGGEGKTATVANLAVVLARAGKRVSVVSADLRRPRLHEFFRANGDTGLTDVLAGRASLDQAMQKITYATSTAAERGSVSLWILPSGRVPENPAELLSSPAMEQVLTALEGSSDIVLIDVPPILPVSDALVVATLAGNVLLVIGPKSSNQTAIVSARQRLDKVGAHIIGGVLNGPDASSVQTYTY